MSNWEDKYNTRINKMNDLLGAKVLGLKIDASKECLQLETDKGQYTFFAVGGCCSHSWIEHINGSQNVIGGTIMELPNLRPEAFQTSEPEDWTYIQDYITKFKTDKGELNVEFRNNSNGYYSGWLELEGDQYNDPVEIPELTEIKKDF